MSDQLTTLELPESVIGDAAAVDSFFEERQSAFELSREGTEGSDTILS